jgi:hypothetical protein
MVARLKCSTPASPTPPSMPDSSTTQRPRLNASAISTIRAHLHWPQRRSLRILQWIVNPIIAGSPRHGPRLDPVLQPRSLRWTLLLLSSHLPRLAVAQHGHPYISSTPSILPPQQTSQLSIDSPEFIFIVRAIAYPPHPVPEPVCVEANPS